MASSMLISIIEAPSSICLAAICNASSYLPSEISLANFLDPATLVLSPTLVKLFLRTSIVTASRPLTFRTLSGKPAVFPDDHGFFAGLSGFWTVFPDKVRGLRGLTASAMAFMWAGVVPQQPPTMLTRPRTAISLTCAAISSGLWSYPPISLGRPAFG